MDKENRKILKTYRTTQNILKRLKTYQKKIDKKYSESDIINEALNDYLAPLEHLDKTKLSDLSNPRFAIMNRYEYFRKKAEILLKEYEKLQRIKITKSKDAVKYLQGLVPLDREIIYNIFLDTSQNIIETKKASEGTVTRSELDVNLTIKDAILLDTWYIISIHNHPTGNPNPSPHDVISARDLYFACRYNKMDLVDSIIIGKNGSYYSFEDKGIISFFSDEFEKANTKMNKKVLVKGYEKYL